jgi:hypothetical protein
MCIPVVRRAVPESWGTSNGTFQTKKVGDVFVDYSDSKRVHLKPDIVEYARNGAPPAYDLILGKQTLHDLGVVLDFKEKTITIDEIILPMRNINNLQLKSSISRALKLNTSFSQEPALRVCPAGSSVGWVLMSIQSLCTKQQSINLQDREVSHHVSGIAAWTVMASS